MLAMPLAAIGLVAVISPISGVSVIPGQTLLAVIWWRANSRARVLVKAIRPPLAPE
jgi:uncharacterized membrane protein YgdD (TMEM256/DUF423 family)